MNHVVRRVGFAIVAAVVLGSVVAVGVAGAGPAGAVTNDTNLTHHEDPAAVDAEGDADRVRGWLSDRLTEQLREQSVRISEGQYEAAEGMLDEEFERRLSQYVDVAGETDGGETAGESGQALERAGTNQRRLGEAVGEFENSYDDYQDARDRGDSDAARQHARRLERLAGEVERRSGNATGALQAVQEETGAETTDVQERIDSVREEVTERQAQVRQATFVETSLQASAGQSVAAFSDPAVIRGRVRTSRDEPIANKRISVRVGERAYATETDGEGAFAVAYRPVGVAADATSVTVEYQPADETPYLPSSDSVDLSIRQVTPNVTVTAHPDEAGYGEEVAVSIGVGVDDRSVPGVPVTTGISGSRIGTTTTASTGVAKANWSIPIDAAVGDGAVAVTVSEPGRAVAPANASTPITVETTPTRLDLDAAADEESITVAGTLAIDSAVRDATVPADLPVVVSVGGHEETVRSGPDGGFQLSVARAALEDAGDAATVRASFAGKSVNLEAASTERQISLPGTESENALPVDGTLLALGATGVIVVLAVVGLLVRRRRRRRRRAASDVSVDFGVDAAGSQPDARTNGAPVPDTEAYSDTRWLAGARAALEDGAVERAVASAYAAAHVHVTDGLGLESVLTPRELVAATERELDPDTHESFVTLTDLYERVVFASEPAENAGERAIEAATDVLESESVATDDRSAPAER